MIRVDKNISVNYIIAVDNEFYISSSNTAGLIHSNSNVTILHTFGVVGKYTQLTYDTRNNTIIALDYDGNKIQIFDRNLNILNTIQTSLYYINGVAVFGSKILVGSFIGFIQIIQNGKGLSNQKSCLVQHMAIDSYGYMFLACYDDPILYLYNVNYDVLTYDNSSYDGKWNIEYSLDLNAHYQNKSINLNFTITAPPSFDSLGRLILVFKDRLHIFSSINATTTSRPTTTTTTIITTTTSATITTTITMTPTVYILFSTLTMITTTIAIPPAAPTDAGAIVGVCTGGFSIFSNTNITICNIDSLGSTRQASEVIDSLKLYFV